MPIPTGSPGTSKLDYHHTDQPLFPRDQELRCPPNAIRSPAAAQPELYAFTPNRNRAAVGVERFVSQHSSERWTMLCFCLLFLPAFWVLRGVLTSTPPCAGRQARAPIPPDLYRATVASHPPAS